MRATAKKLILKLIFYWKKNSSLPNMGIAAEIKKHVADPNTLDMKIVARKIRNWLTLNCKPVME
jgi:hypothetical protein